ncbi:MAG: WD repeat-containing protein 82, partial [Paramarteilia canceri]
MSLAGVNCSPIHAVHSADMGEDKSLKLDENHLKSFRIARHFSLNDKQMNSGMSSSHYTESASQISRICCVDFSSDGIGMIANINNDLLRVFDCVSGRCIQDLNSKKYGVGVVKYTHAKDVILHTSTKVD